MAQAATITIADSVPTNRNYNPISTGNGIAIHVDTVTAQTPAGQSVMSMKLKRATGTTAQRVNVKFDLPVESTVDGTIVVNDVFRFEGSWVIPPSATALQRYNFEALVRNAISHAVVKAYVKDGDPEF